MSELDLMLHPAPGPHRVRAPSISDIHTALVTLPPAFVAAVRKAAGKKRRAKLPYVVGLALVAVIAVLGADRSTREFASSRWVQAKTTLARTTTATAVAAAPVGPVVPVSPIPAVAATVPETAVARVPALVIPPRESAAAAEPSPTVTVTTKPARKPRPSPRPPASTGR